MGKGKISFIMLIMAMVFLCGCGIKNEYHVIDKIKREAGGSKEKDAIVSKVPDVKTMIQKAVGEKVEIIDYKTIADSTQSIFCFAVIVHENQKKLVVIKHKEDEDCLITNNKFAVLQEDEGGVYGDPYDGLSAENNQLVLRFYGGSASWRWIRRFNFSIVNDDIILSKYTFYYFNANVNNQEDEDSILKMKGSHVVVIDFVNRIKVDKKNTNHKIKTKKEKIGKYDFNIENFHISEFIEKIDYMNMLTDDAKEPQKPALSDQGNRIPVEKQLKTMAEAEKTWRLDYREQEDPNFYQGSGWYWYVVTDLDQNGRWELISAVTNGNGGHFTNECYEISRLGDRLEKREGLSELQLVSEAEVYYDRNENQYHYFFVDNEKGGAAYHEIRYRDIVKDKEKILCSVYASEIQDKEEKTYYQGEWERKISKSKFQKLLQQQFGNMEEKQAVFSWFQLDRENGEIYQNLKKSCEHFELQSIKKGK